MTPPAPHATVSRPIASRRAAVTSVVAEIGARRAADIAELLGTRTYADLVREAERASAPRPVLERLAQPGCHLIAEVKRQLAVRRDDRRSGASTRSRAPAPTWPAAPRW